MHWLIAMPSYELFILIFIVFLACCVFYGMLFYIATPTLEQNWWDSFNLAVQTWCTIGYGVLSPTDTSTELVSIACTFTAFLFTSLMTGISFIKFALPYASVTWSKVVCIHTLENEEGIKRPCMSIRMAMIDSHELMLDCTFSVHLISPRVTAENDTFISSDELILKSSHSVAFKGTKTLYHEIDPASTFGQFVMGNKNLKHTDFFIVVRVIAYSMNFQSTVASTKYYHESDIKRGYRYENMVEEVQLSETGDRIISCDLERISEVIKCGSQEELDYKALAKTHEQESRQRIKMLEDKFRDSKRPSSLQSIDSDKKRYKETKRLKRMKNIKFKQTHYEERWCGCRPFRFNTPKPGSHHLKVEVSGHPWYFKCQPAFWFTSLVRGNPLLCIIILATIYFLCILIFASFMYLGHRNNAIAEETDPDMPFLTYIWWSHHTLSSVGYGTQTPGSPYGNFITAVEGIFGLILASLVAGVAWSKFYQTVPRILWSQYAVVTTLNGEPHLMVRCASLWRGHLMLTANLSISAVVRNHDRKHLLAKDIPLKLVKDQNPTFALTATFMHKITEDSPLSTILSEEYRKKRGWTKKKSYDLFNIVCLLESFDGLFQQYMVSHMIYQVMEESHDRYDDDNLILVGEKFDDIISQQQTSKKIVIDYGKFHSTSTEDGCEFAPFDGEEDEDDQKEKVVIEAKKRPSVESATSQLPKRSSFESAVSLKRVPLRQEDSALKELRGQGTKEKIIVDDIEEL